MPLMAMVSSSFLVLMASICISARLATWFGLLITRGCFAPLPRCSPLPLVGCFPVLPAASFVMLPCLLVGWTRVGLLLALAHAVVRRLQQRAQKIFDEPALAGLDLDRHVHPRRERNDLAVFHHNGRLMHADTGAVEETGLLDRHRVPGKRQDLPLNNTVTGERESLDLDFGLLVFIHETDVLVLDEGLDLDLALVRRDDHELLRRGDHAAHGVHRELLHDAVYRGRQVLLTGAGLGLGGLLR